MAWRFLRVVKRRWASWALGFSILCLATAATAEAGSRVDELARRHFEAGAAYLEQAEYDSALREFQRAYELSGRAEILIDVATVHERLGEPARAIEALQQYLQKAPEGEHAETVRVRIENLEKRLEEQAPEAEAAEEPSPPVAPAPAPAPENRPASPAPPPPPAADASASKPPFWESEQLPAYILFTVSGVSAAGSLLTGVLATKEHSDAEKRCSPNCTDSEVATGKTLAVTSTVLTGAAVVTAAVGAVLFFELKPDDERQSQKRPAVGVGLGPGGARARATWRF